MKFHTAVGPRLDHVVAVRHVALVARGQHQVLAALALVGSGGAHVGDVAEVHVVEDAEHVGGDLDHGGSVLLEIEKAPGVERGVVPGQHQRLGIAHLLGDHDLVGLGVADVALSLADVVHGDRGHHVDEHLHGTGAVDVVVDLLGGVADGHAVEELEGADGRIHLVRSGDLVRNRRGVFVDRFVGADRRLRPGGGRQKASQQQDGQRFCVHGAFLLVPCSSLHGIQDAEAQTLSLAESDACFTCTCHLASCIAYSTSSTSLGTQVLLLKALSGP